MARLTQVDECLHRCLAGTSPLENQKLQAKVEGHVLTMWHSHQKLLVYDVSKQQVLYRCVEPIANQRMLLAAIAYLEDYFGNADAANCTSQPATRPRAPSPTSKLRLGQLGDCCVAHGERLEDRGSLFLAHLAFPLRSEAAARAAVQRMKAETYASSATHNVSAYRLLVNGLVVSGCDDDGEDKAGAKLLSMLTAEKALDVAVVVSRWFGGVNLGPVRFKHFCDSARALLKLHVTHATHANIPRPSEVPAFTGRGHQLDPTSSVDAGTAAARREAVARAAEQRAAALANRGISARGKRTAANAERPDDGDAERKRRCGTASTETCRVSQLPESQSQWALKLKPTVSNVTIDLDD